ncbi:MAG: response regulator transcription factor [Chloroflexi bacterium]|nr:response regulator transcription factor [Chloroflexota bacterium]
MRVLVVALDSLARAGLAALLAAQPDSVVVGQSDGSGDLIADLGAYRPDVLVWDLGWDLSKAVERLAELPESAPPVVALLAEGPQAALAWAAGARGLLLRDADGAILVAAMRAVTHGVVALDPRLVGTLMSAQDSPSPSSAGELSARELEVLQLLAEGLPNKTIAQRLSISEHTVKFHVNSILGKLGAQSRTEAVTRGIRGGLIHL